MNLGQIELALYDRLGFDANPDPAVTRRFRRYINDAHREVLGKKGFQRLRRRTLTAVCVANSPYMVMPQAANAIIVIADRTNNRNLTPISLQDLRYRDPGLNFSGSIPDSYAIINMAACVALDPSAAASLFIISDSASDGSGLAVNIEGITSAGVVRRASVALNGVTAVNIDANCTTWVAVTKFYLSGSAAGNVTLHQTSGVGTELALISKGRSYPRYTQIHLSPTPSAAATYYCDVELHIEDMVNVTDEPLIPEDYHRLLESGALKREFLRRKDMAELSVEQATWRDTLADLQVWVRARGGVSTGGQRGSSGRQFSQLGSMFQSGS